jgi:glutaconate CoA-transferase subunit A
VPELDPRPDAAVLPAWTVTYVAAAPGGSRPSYALGYYDRDNDAYQAWDPIARDRDRFLAWLETEIYPARPAQAAHPAHPARPESDAHV